MIGGQLSSLPPAPPIAWLVALRQLAHPCFQTWHGVGSLTPHSRNADTSTAKACPWRDTALQTSSSWFVQGAKHVQSGSACTIANACSQSSAPTHRPECKPDQAPGRQHEDHGLSCPQVTQHSGSNDHDLRQQPGTQVRRVANNGRLIGGVTGTARTAALECWLHTTSLTSSVEHSEMANCAHSKSLE